MKKHLLLIATVTLALTAQAQILNPSFEDAHPNGGPAHWVRILSIAFPCTVSEGYDSTYFQTTDVHTGNFAIEMRNAHCDDIYFNGGANLSQVDEFYSSNGMDFITRPSSISLFYKLLPLGGDIGHITIELTDQVNGNTIASADYLITQPATEYTQLTIPLEYVSTENPTHLSMSMGITNQTSHVTFGTRFLVDDVSALATGVTETKATALTVFPNPSNGSITIKSQGNEPVQMIVYNAMGQQVKNAKVPVNTMIATGDLTTGNYFYQIISNTKTAQTGKLMIE